MAGSGKGVLKANGRGGVLDSGKGALFNSSDACAQCCGGVNNCPCAFPYIYIWITAPLSPGLRFDFTPGTTVTIDPFGNGINCAECVGFPWYKWRVRNLNHQMDPLCNFQTFEAEVAWKCALETDWNVIGAQSFQLNCGNYNFQSGGTFNGMPCSGSLTINWIANNSTEPPISPPY